MEVTGNPYSGMWGGITGGVTAITNGILTLSGTQQIGQEVAIAQAAAAAEKAKVDAAAQQQRYKYYAIGGTIVFLLVIIFIIKYFRKTDTAKTKLT